MDLTSPKDLDATYIDTHHDMSNLDNNDISPEKNSYLLKLSESQFASERSDKSIKIFDYTKDCLNTLSEHEKENIISSKLLNNSFSPNLLFSFLYLIKP